ncbi:MAG: hypothetical protein KKF62_11295 [Bacteroidetes bacterium]|nr:hypothetical protein [Bacteroidota bacterium]MBU1116316.1 hypothetical protein [Bacteroidota bacterium]MBU1798298.1 hypothetical protein [Bacteroidota bacterium]
MSKKAEPWYLHAGLWAVIVVLVVILIQVSISGPNEIVRTREYNKNESRLRMKNLKQAQILFENRYDKFTDNLDTLINFVKSDTNIHKLMKEFDTVKVYSAKGDSTILKSRNPFVELISGPFNFDSLYFSPKSGRPFIVKVDTLLEVDTVINRRGTIVKIDSITTIGKRYLIKNPDSDDKIGDVDSDALLNTESWD